MSNASFIWICPKLGLETKPKKFDFEYERVETIDGYLVESKTASVWGCSCCFEPEALDANEDMHEVTP